MITNISIEKLHEHPDNPRKNIGDVSELAESIKVSGILQNLTVVPCTGHYYGDYTVIIGHRRLAAAKLAGLREVPCAVVEMDTKEQLATMLLENMQRSDLTIYEQAQGMQMMLDLGETVEDIAQKTGFSQSTVYRRVRLAKLDPEAFKLSEGKQVSMIEYDKLFEIEDESRRNEVLKEIGTSNFNNRVLQAKSVEESIKERAELIKKLNEFAEETKETSSLKFVGYVSMKGLETISIDESVKYYYAVYSYGIPLYCELTQEEKEKQAAATTESGEKRRKRDEYKARLDEIASRAYQLRKNFVLELKNLNGIRERIYEFAARMMVNEYYAEVDLDEFLKMCGIYAEDDNFEDAWDLYEDAFNKNPLRGLLIAAYCKSGDHEKNNYHCWNNEYDGNAALDTLYKCLERLGYEMSDEEIAMCDGTLEFYEEIHR